jgi:hypothetical protein
LARKRKLKGPVNSIIEKKPHHTIENIYVLAWICKKIKPNPNPNKVRRKQEMATLIISPIGFLGVSNKISSFFFLKSVASPND